MDSCVGVPQRNFSGDVNLHIRSIVEFKHQVFFGKCSAGPQLCLARYEFVFEARSRIAFHSAVRVADPRVPRAMIQPLPQQTIAQLASEEVPCTKDDEKTTCTRDQCTQGLGHCSYPNIGGSSKAHFRGRPLEGRPATPKPRALNPAPRVLP